MIYSINKIIPHKYFALETCYTFLIERHTESMWGQSTNIKKYDFFSSKVIILLKGCSVILTPSSNDIN